MTTWHDLKLADLCTAAQNYTHTPYDERLRHIMTAEEFERYKQNPGHSYYAFLKNLVHMLQPQHVLELGTSIGRSAAFMMTALPAESQLTTIELCTYRRCDLAPFESDPRLRIVFGDDTDPSVYEPLALKNIDFLYIDSLHTHEHATREWWIYQQFLRDGAVVVLDDIELSPDMVRFWDVLPFEKVACPESVHFSGFGVFRFRA